MQADQVAHRSRRQICSQREPRVFSLTQAAGTAACITRCKEEKAMKSQNLATNDHSVTTTTRSDEPAERDKNGPSLAEIRQRALEIHLERGGDDSDLENYLDDWLQAARELQEKYNKSSGE
jgi:hypothetical protein